MTKESAETDAFVEKQTLASQIMRASEGEPPVLAKAPFTQMTAGEPRRCHREHCVPHVPHTQHASRVQVGPAALSPRARPIAAGGQHAQAAREADRLHRTAAD